MTFLQAFLAAFAGFGVGADFGTTRAALRSGWMQEVGPVAVRIGVPATVVLRLVIVAVTVPLMAAPGLTGLLSAGAAFVAGASGLWVATGNVHRLWARREDE